MKKISIVAIAACITAITLGGCHKKDYNNAPEATSGDAIRLAELFTSLKPTPQALVVTAGTYQVVEAAGGTKLTFYPNSFKDASGNIITSGTVNLQVTEAYSAGAMIANGALTCTDDGRLLRSGGEVNINASIGGHEVYANRYGLSFNQPAASAQPMSLFIGNTAANGSTTWSLGDNTAGMTAPATKFDSLSHASHFYLFDSCNHFNWINCDQFNNSTSPLTDINITFPDASFNDTNTKVFIIFPQINAVSGPDLYNFETHSFNMSIGHYLPEGMTINIVTISSVGTKYYYSYQGGLTVTTNMVARPVPVARSRAYIASDLASR